MKLLLFALLLVIFALPVLAQMPKIEPGVPHDLAIWRAAHYSDVRYKLNLTLEKMSPVLKGTIEIHVVVEGEKGRKGEGEETRAGSLRSDAVPPIILDWRKLAGHEKDSTITNVTLNGQVLSSNFSLPVFEKEPAKAGTQNYYDFNEHLIFRDGVRAGENVIKLDFTSPILTSGSAITRYIDKEDGSEYLYSLFVPSDASTAFPVFDQPDLKARFSLVVWAPEDWKIISNAKSGVSIGQDDQSIRENEWSVCGPDHKCPPWYKRPQLYAQTGFDETKPISTYVFAFAAGPWHSFQEVSSYPGAVRSEGEREPKDGNDDYLNRIYPRIFVRESQVAKFSPHANETFRLMREGIKYLEDYFDFKFPWPKYDLVLIPEFPFGGMEHAGATFLNERGVIFPSEPTANDYISRANLIFHETAHQWFGDTVTMRWFDDLWLKEGFAEFMAYKTLEKTMPQYNAWKAFYERNKPAAYFTDSTRGTTPIYQPIDNLSAAKSAYGNIVYRKAPSFLRQAEFYLGPDKFQTAVRAFLKKHAFANATWQDLVSEFEFANGKKPPLSSPLSEDQKYAIKRYETSIGADLTSWAQRWVIEPEVFRIRIGKKSPNDKRQLYSFFREKNNEGEDVCRPMKFRLFVRFENGKSNVTDVRTACDPLAYNPKKFYLEAINGITLDPKKRFGEPLLIFPNYQDYGYGIFLLDDRSLDYVLKNIQNEKDDFLRSMMWGSLWDSVREAELDPRQYVELAIKVLSSNFSLPDAKQKPAKAGTQNSPAKAGTQNGETDETIIASVLNHVSTAMTYYLSEPPAPAGGQSVRSTNWPPANAGGSDLQARLEAMIIDRMRTAPTMGQRLTYYRAFLNIVSTENGRGVLKGMLRPARPSTTPPDKSGTPPIQEGSLKNIPLKTKDRFDIVTRLAVLGDPDAPKLLADLEKTETSDDAKRYAYAAHAAFATRENREKFWNDFVNNASLSESWIEAAMGPFNSPKHSDLSLPYLQRALAELPNLKRNRKIFFVNGWLGAFLGGQKSQEALDMVNKFLADNPNLDRDLRLKILENMDVIERAVKIRSKFSQNPLR